MSITERITQADRKRLGQGQGQGTTLHPLLRRATLAKFLNDGQLKDLEALCRTLTRGAGHTIFRQDEEPTATYLVLRGSVELRARPPGRRVYRTIEVVGTGCTVGDEALVGEQRYLSSARTQEASRLLVLSRPEFARVSEARPDIAIALLRCAGSCLIQTVRRAAILTQAPADVALELLLRELSAESRDHGRQGAVRITHAQLAGLLHLSRETVSRMLGQMASNGLVELARGSIKLRTA
jgi:CRP/FNR family transcriptional regulator, cyclic AMP receptor protein